VFAVNKADRDGADATVRDLELMIALGGEVLAGGQHSRGHAPGALDIAKQVVTHREGAWVPPVVKCVASRNEGIGELMTKLQAHHAWLTGTEVGRKRREARAMVELTGTLRDALVVAALSDLGPAIEAAALEVATRQVDPYSACEALVARFRRA
jgi:LAO/AO transport system kinase